MISVEEFGRRICTLCIRRVISKEAASRGVCGKLWTKKSAPCAFGESFFKEDASGGVSGKFWTNKLHSLHPESFFEEQAPVGAYGRGRKKIRIICIWRICRRLRVVSNLLYITKHGSRNFEDRNQERILKETLGPDTPSCGFNPNPSRLALAEDTTCGCQQGGRGFIEVCTEAVEQREYSHQAKHTQLRIQPTS